MKITLGKTISRALRAQKKIGTLIEAALKVPRGKTKGARHTSSRPKRFVLQETSAFGSNPGRLVMKSFVPPRLQKRPALVVLLHGCHQTPESLDAASSFSKLAKRGASFFSTPSRR
ncbi:poly(3-hydroxybutyrate) depolymerase [Ensifer sp. 4252]